MERDPYWSLTGLSGTALEERIGALLGPARLRVQAALQDGFDGSTADLLRLVDAEQSRPETATTRLRRDRWTGKIDVLAARLWPGASVVDCGCGFGTEAMAFALRGADVIAVDLVGEQLRLLERRVGMYAELLGVRIEERVTTVQANLTDYDPGRTFDFAWSNESIEHIVPLDGFFARLPGWLADGGTAVICNDNALNPVRHAMVIRSRGALRVPMVQIDSPLTGEPMTYAMEDIHVPGGIRRRLRRAGFSEVRLLFQNVVPSVLVRGTTGLRLAAVAEGLTSVPVLRHVVAGDYIALATV